VKIRFTKKVIFIGVAYLILCGIFVVLCDLVFAIKLAFLLNILAGMLTIIGGFLLAYWLIESDKIERENKRELERKKRVISALTTFKNCLLPWIFNFACILSGHFLNYDNYLIYSGKYRNDIPELEDIFGIQIFDSQGRRLRGTAQATAISNLVYQRPQTPQSLYGTLQYGLRSLKPIEKKIIEFPSLVEEVEPEVAKIVHLSNNLRLRIEELKNWEKKPQRKPDDKIDTAMISNLLTVGSSSLDIVLAIESNIEKLSSESRN
jgi:hypothetical protein